MNIHAVTMIRNEIDIVDACIQQSRELFDSHSFVDMQSIDGTRARLDRAASETPSISVLDYRTQAKYQSEICGALVRDQVAEGADWVFLLDTDEFLRVDSREDLELQLKEFSSDVMFLPWINVIPTRFGSYEHFDFDQEFRWRGRVSPYRKVALSSRFVSDNPGFWLLMGNHGVRNSYMGPNVSEHLGIPMLHLPVRSAERLSYKARMEVRVLQNKVNQEASEGKHATDIVTELDTHQMMPESKMRVLCAGYGDDIEFDKAMDNMDAWPVLQLPAWMRAVPPAEGKRLGLNEVLAGEKQIEWRKHDFVKGGVIRAEQNEGEIVLRCQPFRGDGSLVEEKYAPLGARDTSEMLELNDLESATDVLTATFISPRVYEFSAWSELIPVLSGILAIARPRRFVELGVHNGMSFLAACNTAQRLGLEMQAVAIDSWVGDDHAGFHDPQVFNGFKRNIGNVAPKQHYIRGMFDDAAECFEDGSIDLLHIDGFHSYEAVRNDFETWLPKMTDTGLVMFHDTNVYQNDFGVWRYWAEISQQYPSFGFKHSHGLGLLYVGSQDSPIKTLLTQLSEQTELAEIVQTGVIGIGELMIDRLRFKFEQGVQHAPAPVNYDPGDVDATLRSVIDDKWWRRTRPFRKASNKIRKLRGRPQKSWPDLQPK